MPLSDEIRQAAHELGAALRETPALQSYLESNARFQSDSRLAELEAEINSLYRAIAQRERSDQPLSYAEASHYHDLIEQLRRSPLYIQREVELKEAQVLLAQTAEILSSVLSVSYHTLVS